MASNDINVKYRVTEDGGLDKVAKGADKAAKNTDKATRSAGHYQKKQKGVAGATANGTKAFSKMTDGINGGLVPAYAEIAARVFALTAIFGQLKNAFAVEQLEAGFTRLGNISGQTAISMAKTIQTATGNAVSLEQALRSTAAGFSAGFSTDEMEGLAKIAKGASIALGRDLADSLDRLIRGTAKLEPEILDELGIFVRLDDAVNEYATSLNKAASALTDSERRQAFLNKALGQGLRKFGDLADVDANPYDKLYANFEELRKGFLSIVNTIAGPVVNLLANSMIALVGTFVLFGAGIAKHIFPSLNQLGDKLAERAKKAKVDAEEVLKARKKLVEASKVKITEGAVSSKKSKFSQVQGKLRNKEKVGVGELEIALKSLEQSENRRQKNIDNGSVKNIKAKKAELAVIRAQKRAIEDLIDAEKGRGAAGMDLRSRRKGSQAESKLGQTIENIGEMGAIEGFKEANKGFKDYKENIDDVVNSSSKWTSKNKTLNKMLKKFAPTAVLAGAGARVFGAALVNALPFIGQIMFALGLLIQGLTSLYKAITKPTEAEKRLEEQTKSVTEKVKQLEERNKKLESSFKSLAIQELLRSDATDLANMSTDEAIKKMAELNKQAAQDAAVHEFANNLQVTSGVIKEFTGNVTMLASELEAEDYTKKGLLASLFMIYKSKVLGTIADGFRAIGDGIVFMSKAIISAPAKLFDLFKSALKMITPEVVQDAFKEISDGVKQFATDIAEEQAIERFVEGTTESYDALVDATKDTGIQIPEIFRKQFEDGFKRLEVDNFSDFLKAGLEEAKTEGPAAVKAFQTQILAAFTLIEAKTTESSNAIIKFAENVKKGQTAMTTFMNGVKNKNPYTVLGNDVQSTINAIARLEKASELPGSEGFAAQFGAQVRAGAIDVTRFGLTVEQVSAEGSAAFDPLKVRIGLVAEAFDTAKNKAATLKAEISQLQANFNNANLYKTLDLSLQSLKAGGKFEVTAAQAGLNAATAFKQRIAFINEEFRLKSELIDQELELERLKLEFAKSTIDATTEAGAAQLKNLNDQLAVLRQMSNARKDSAANTAIGQRTQAQIDFQSTGQSSREGLISAIGAEDSQLGKVKRLQDAMSTPQQHTTSDDQGNITTTAFAGTDQFTRMATDAEGNVSVAENQAGAAQERLKAYGEAISPMIENLKSLGPEGELMAGVTQGAFTISDAFMNMSDNISDGASKLEKGAEMAQFAATAISEIGNMMAASSAAKVAGIDKEIEAEKRRDGKSAASVAKIKALEAKKTAVEKKNFEQQKKMKMAAVIASTAAAIMKESEKGFPAALPGVALFTAMGAMQLATIAKTSFSGGGSAAKSGPTSISVGERQNKVDLASSRNALGELAYARGESGVGTGMGNYKPAFAGYKHRATGGYVVGEQGPEVFMPQVPGTILPSDESANMSSGNPVNVNFTIQAIDTQNMQDALAVQRNNIIGMIREAAHSTGDGFLESVDINETV